MALSWFDGLVAITVEAAFSASTGAYGAWDAGLWDTATWGPDVVWVDVSPYVRSVHTERRFATEVRKWGTGVAGVVLNNRDGRFSADNMAGPYVTAGVTGIRPWRPIRIRANFLGVSYYLYTGYILDYVDTWVQGHTDAFVTLPCVDEWAAISDFDGLGVSAVGAGELSGARIHRILNNAGHTGARAIDAGQVTMQATTLASNAATELDLTVDSEGGGLFIDADGTVVYERQYALIENTRSNTVQATFGDGTGTELPCADITPVNTGQKVRNIVAYARVGGTAQTAADATSRALYHDKRLTRSDLVCETDAQALALATFDLEVYKAPKKLFSAIRLLPLASPTALFPQVLGRRVRDLIRTAARPLGSPTITRDCLVAGISHDITGDNWVTDFDLWDASVYQLYSTSRWDVGQWDSAAWFF